jgi:hypothetical protein
MIISRLTKGPAALSKKHGFFPPFPRVATVASSVHISGIRVHQQAVVSRGGKELNLGEREYQTLNDICKAVHILTLGYSLWYRQAK